MTVLLAYTVSISIVRDKEVMNINPHTSYDNESVLPSSNLKVYTIYVSSEGNTHVHTYTCTYTPSRSTLTTELYSTYPMDTYRLPCNGYIYRLPCN